MSEGSGLPSKMRPEEALGGKEGAVSSTRTASLEERGQKSNWGGVGAEQVVSEVTTFQ